MITKYALLNPLDGSYTYETDYNTALQALSNIVLNFYKAYTHDQLCSYVTIDAVGLETWSNTAGIKILSPTELKASLVVGIKPLVPSTDTMTMPIAGASLPTTTVIDTIVPSTLPTTTI